MSPTASWAGTLYHRPDPALETRSYWTEAEAKCGTQTGLKTSALMQEQECPPQPEDTEGRPRVGPKGL